MSDIHFILTGGTIDKIYNPITEKPETNHKSVIPAYIENIIKPHKNITFETLCLKDSLEITQADRKKILEAINSTDIKKIIVVHGTSTMEETARYLEQNPPQDIDKAVVLTGAMIPLKEFPRSDGGFNLGFAIGAIEHIENGVHLCMNAQIFEPQNVTKDIETGRFSYKKAFALHAQ